MASEYQEARRICMDELLEFRCDINDLLPDEPNGDKYLIDWTLEDCEYVQRCVSRTIDVILSTCMANHVSYELRSIQNTYDAAIKEKDIPRCRRILNGIMKEFAMVHAACKAIPKED